MEGEGREGRGEWERRRKSKGERVGWRGREKKVHVDSETGVGEVGEVGEKREEQGKENGMRVRKGGRQRG